MVPQEDGTQVEKEFKDSFNIEKIIRSVTHTDGTIIVILDDFNERVSEEPDIDLKTNKFKGYKKVRQTVQSEIVLSPQDGERFFDMLDIQGPTCKEESKGIRAPKL
jgi:hypothetical protein